MESSYLSSFREVASLPKQLLTRCKPNTLHCLARFLLIKVSTLLWGTLDQRRETIVSERE